MAQRFEINRVGKNFTNWIRDTAVIVNNFFREVSNTNDNVTAGTPQTQAGATGLEHGFNRVTSASANDGVRLPLTSGGGEVIVRNDSGAAVKVWPPSGMSIDGGAANAADGNNLATGKTRHYEAMSATDWYTIGNS